MQLLNTLLNEMYNSDGYVLYDNEEDGILLIPSEDKQYYMPNLVVKNVEELENIFTEYLNIINSSSLKFYTIDEIHQVKNYLFYLIKSLTNTDCQDLSTYIRRFNLYLQDSNFDDLYYSKKIGKLESFDILSRRCEEYYGSETPFTIRYYAERPGFKFEMPLVRYGICENEVYIYSIQRKKLYNNKHCAIKEVNSIFNRVNKGVKTNRDITPSMLCSLAIFLGMIKSLGINKVKADGFLTRRFGYLDGITSEEQREKVLSNSIDKFSKLFVRVFDQFDGINITAYPFDVDSYFHLEIGDSVSSKNELLDYLYNMGHNYSKDLEKKDSLVKKYKK